MTRTKQLILINTTGLACSRKAADFKSVRTFTTEASIILHAIRYHVKICASLDFVKKIVDLLT